MTPEQEKLLTCIEDPGAAKNTGGDMASDRGRATCRRPDAPRIPKRECRLSPTPCGELPAKWQTLEERGFTKADLHRARFVQDFT